MAEHQQNEVRVALVMDDQATATLQKVADAMAALHKQQEEVAKSGAKAGEDHGKKHGEGFANKLKEKIVEGVFIAAGEKLIEGVIEKLHELPDLLKEAFHAGVNEIEGQRAIAGTLTLTGVKGSFEQVLDQAKLYKDSLEDIGVEAGVADNVLQDVFEGIAARSNKSAIEVEELTEKIAYAGKAIHGGPQAIAQGFQMMEMGMIRAKNPIVQMIVASKTLEGNAKSVAKQLMKMSPEEAIKLGEQAIDRMAKKMKDAPPTFQQLMTSFSGMKEQMFEALGVPLVEALVPHLDTLKHWLIEHKGALESYARAAAKFIGESFDDIAHWIDDMKLLFENKDFATGLQDAGDMLKGAFKLGVDVAKGIVEAGAGLAMMWGDFKNTITGGARAGTFGEAGQRWAAERDRKENIDAAKFDLKYAANPEYYKAAQAAMANAGLANTRFTQAGGELTGEDDKAFQDLQKQLDAAAVYGEKLREFSARGDVDAISGAFNDASKKHEDGTRYYVARLIGGSESLQDQLLKSGVELQGGFSGIITMLRESGLGEQADKLAKKVKEHGAKQSSPVVNFNGGQTFQIKQDFRDQDPDRIAVLFRQDILKAAASRTQSNRATAFGF